MARTINALLNNTSGKIGDAFVVKQYKHGIVISAVPDMSRVKKSKLQTVKQDRFKDAVKYAQGIIHDPKKKATYAKKIPKGKSVYNAAIQEYMNKVKKENGL